MKSKYIKEFEKKYNLEFVKEMDGDVLSFEEDTFPPNGRHNPRHRL